MGAVRCWFLSLEFVSLLLSCCVLSPQVAERGQQLVVAALGVLSCLQGNGSTWILSLEKGSGGCEMEGSRIWGR